MEQAISPSTPLIIHNCSELSCFVLCLATFLTNLRCNKTLPDVPGGECVRLTSKNNLRREKMERNNVSQTWEVTGPWEYVCQNAESPHTPAREPPTLWSEASIAGLGTSAPTQSGAVANLGHRTKWKYLAMRRPFE